jgi:4'-phosphopantetheinyl transferase
MPSTPAMPPTPPTLPTPPPGAAPAGSTPGLRPAWWTADGGFAPDLEPVSSSELPQVWLVGVAGQSEREAARRAIRSAVRAALAALLGIDPAAVDLPAAGSAAGTAPYALVHDAAAPRTAPRRIALAISHDEALSVAAIGLAGAVGIDVMCIADIPDWEALARDYLGPDAARTLAALDPSARPVALAQGWSEREARLKCVGLGLGEWRADEAAALAHCICRPLALPAGYVGYLAVVPGATG